MQLTTEQFKHFQEKMGQFWRLTGKCDVCGFEGGQWALTDKVFELRPFNKGEFVVGGGQELLPVVAATCSNCGNTKLFNAIVLGIIEPKRRS